MTDPELMLARAWLKVNKNGPVPVERPELGPCWLWTGGKCRGYGIVQVQRHQLPKQIKAHRFLYESVNGPLPKGVTLDHLCRNPGCVRSDHLEAVTMRENTLRGVGPSAVNARKTHCIHGHPFEGKNLYMTPTGLRACRTCSKNKEKRRVYRAQGVEK